MKTRSNRLTGEPANGLALACLISLVLCCIPSLAPQQAPGTDWKRIQEAFGSYLSDPSPVHGGVLVNSLPTRRITLKETDSTYNDLQTTLSLIFSPDNFGRFMTKVRQGDMYAIEAAFRIFNFTDGGASESIMIVLGDSLREHPQTFLEVARKESKLFSPEDLRAPAIMTRYEVGSELEAHELKLRLEALRGVNIPSLLLIKNVFIKEILKTLGERTNSNLKI